MARSPVFYAMFSHGMQESERGEVRIPDFEAPVVRELLHFMYTDRLSEDSAVSVSRAAADVPVRGLFLKYDRYMVRAIGLLQMAFDLNTEQLKRAYLQYIATNLHDMV